MITNQARAKTVDAEVKVPFGRIELVRNTFFEPVDMDGVAPVHHLELSLMPRSRVARACFPEHWGPHRFEPIGEMFLMPADQRIHCKSDCRQQNSIAIDYEPAAVEQWFENDLPWTDGRLRGSLDITSARLRSLLFRIGEEVRNPGFAAETMVELMAAQVAIELSRHLMGIGESKPMGGLAGWRLRLIDDRLADETQPPPSLNELADLCHLSVRHLTRAFRVTRGRSVGSYIAEHRIDHAKRLLASGMSVKSVAYSTGFTAPSNFAAAFVRATGETPSQYRQRSGRPRASTAHSEDAVH